MKKFILLSLLILSQVLGDIWLSRGMKQFGEVNLLNSSMLLHLSVYLFTNFWILLGVCFLACSLFFYLIAISRFDLSYVLPIHSFSYVLNAFFAWSILGENIPSIRWVSTLLISMGVLLVSFSESKPSKKFDRQNSKFKNRNLFLFLLPFNLSISKTWFAVMILVLADSCGDVLLAMGMKQIGKVNIKLGWQMLKLVRRIITNSLIIGGVFCQTIALIAFLNLLSWTEISFVRPLTSLTYVFSLLGAKFILKEQIVPERLVGIFLIITGVFIHR